MPNHKIFAMFAPELHKTREMALIIPKKYKQKLFGENGEQKVAASLMRRGFSPFLVKKIIKQELKGLNSRWLSLRLLDSDDSLMSEINAYLGDDFIDNSKIFKYNFKKG